MFRIIRENGRVRIAAVCDQCGGEIDNARMAIVVTANERGDMATLHKGACDRVFKAGHPEAASGCLPLDHALVVAAGGMGIGIPEFEWVVRLAAMLETIGQP
jgi:hypothetical protein